MIKYQNSMYKVEERHNLYSTTKKPYVVRLAFSGLAVSTHRNLDEAIKDADDREREMEKEYERRN